VAPRLAYQDRPDRSCHAGLDPPAGRCPGESQPPTRCHVPRALPVAMGQSSLACSKAQSVCVMTALSAVPHEWEGRERPCYVSGERAQWPASSRVRGSGKDQPATPRITYRPCADLGEFAGRWPTEKGARPNQPHPPHLGRRSGHHEPAFAGCPPRSRWPKRRPGV
jgi:hypothetical protein